MASLPSNPLSLEHLNDVIKDGEDDIESLTRLINRKREQVELFKAIRYELYSDTANVYECEDIVKGEKEVDFPD